MHLHEIHISGIRSDQGLVDLSQGIGVMSFPQLRKLCAILGTEHMLVEHIACIVEHANGMVLRDLAKVA